MGGQFFRGQSIIHVREQRGIHGWRKRYAVAGLVITLSTLSLVGSDMELSRATGRCARTRSSVQQSNVHPVPRSSLDSLRSTLRRYIKAFGNAPFVYPVVNAPCIKGVLSGFPGSRALYGSKWDRKHPFDRQYGTDTSGFLYGDDILTGHPAEEHGSPYAGAQPSVVRAALATLPRIESSTFIDLGCGKGRPMLIASEFGFRDIVGVELSPSLAQAARRNAEVIARRYPARTLIRVEVGDATTFPMPDGDVVLFLYNSFDRELTQKVAANVEAALKENAQRAIFVVYCNPASGACFDTLPLLTRRFAQTLQYTLEERDCAEDKEDAVIIWQGGNLAQPATPSSAEIVIVKERWRAELRA
jgi:SAM-dependent methyltransferase